MAGLIQIVFLLLLWTPMSHTITCKQACLAQNSCLDFVNQSRSYVNSYINGATITTTTAAPHHGVSSARKYLLLQLFGRKRSSTYIVGIYVTSGQCFTYLGEDIYSPLFRDYKVKIQYRNTVAWVWKSLVITKPCSATPTPPTIPKPPATPTTPTTPRTTSTTVASTTTTAATTSTKCLDRMPNCDAYGVNVICQHYPDIAKVSCRKTCSLC